jgi:hypothetical protein
MIRTSWNKVKAGDIVQFRYRGQKKGARDRLRVCLILNPKHNFKRKTDGRRVRLVHAVQFSAEPSAGGTRAIPKIFIQKLLLAAGNAEERDDSRFAITTNENARVQYQHIERVMRKRKSDNVYRTFSWGNLNKRSVFHHTGFDWPMESVRHLIDAAPKVKEEEL